MVVAVVADMPAFVQGPDSFIDNYILLLAARFNAPLDAATSFDRRRAASWENVALCVRRALAHPLTDDERREVAHVDASLFSADVCRWRALYVQWRSRGQIAAPSTFDVTRDSLRDEVQGIYAAVKANLPTTLGSRFAGNGGGNLGGKNKNGKSSAEEFIDDDSNHSDEDDGVIMNAVGFDFSGEKEEEKQRNRVIAKARDEFLTKVQAMQVEFFAQHRRWVDVPFDMITSASTPRVDQSGSVAESPGVARRDSPAVSKSAMQEALEARNPHVAASRASREATASTVSGNTTEEATNAEVVSPMNAFEALRRSVHISRPPRPSQMLEEDYQVHYGAVVTDMCNGNGNERLEAEFENYKRMKEGEKSRNPQRDLSPNHFAPRGPTQPTVRAHRWNVVEYDEDGDGDSEDMQ